MNTAIVILILVFVVIPIWGYFEPEVENELYVATKLLVLFLAVYTIVYLMPIILC